jgi:UDP-4-amino-4-deoxy-L-arabinose-oxoglutarate aminotransferase
MTVTKQLGALSLSSGSKINIARPGCSSIAFTGSPDGMALSVDYKSSFSMSGEMTSFLPFSRPCITESEIKAVADVMRSGWITTGARAAELEQRFCEAIGCSYAVALSSATAGMHLLLHALDIGAGDEVITPSMTWVSTINQIILRGARPVFVDIERDTLMTSADLIEPHISERTRLIVPVHFAGAPLDMKPLRAMAASYGIPLVEDAAHALGATCREEPVGGRGTAIFSMHPVKNITTAEGGMFCTEDAALAERIRRLKFHGLGVDAFDRETHGRAPQVEVLEPGFKYNLPDMNAVLGLGQLARLEAMIGRRTELAMHYRRLLAGVDEIQPLVLPDYPCRHGWNLFVVRLDSKAAGLTRDEFMAALKKRGVGIGLHFRAAHTQKYYQGKAPVMPGILRDTEWNAERICSLPLFPDMHENDVRRVVTAIHAVLREG